ncbi:regulator of MON1-CCZ1 complex protein bulli [Arctopsyche grandis]|uniref:regulator of MON1-CCZ1 complex protein bulli n=1 Tax=Arctopsyche grandis TaxID=121162 RepID=UPI00406D8AE5
MEEHCLELSENPILFDCVTVVTNVFFDDTNGQVFAVRSSGVTGVIVKGPNQDNCTTFRMEDKGRVISIKFSPDMNILGIQRSHGSVDFINFANLIPTSSEYSQGCKWKNGSILGFVWVKANEIAFITDRGIELLQVVPEKKQFKSLKIIKIDASWFSWCAQSKLVLLASPNGVFLHPFTFNNSSINKLPRVEMESDRPVTDSDVSCTRLYDSSWCLVLRHGGKCPAEVLALPVNVPGTSQIHAFRTGLVGRFAINVVDNLVVVHHQASQTSMLFDIMEEGTMEGEMKVHGPITFPMSLKPVTVPDLQCQMYSGNWVVFQPDIVIDARLGCLWRVVLKPAGLIDASRDYIVSILLRRREGRQTIYAILKNMVSEGNKCLTGLMKVFDQINHVYRKQAELDLAKQTGQNSNQCDSTFNNTPNQNTHHRFVITQQDMYTNVLQYFTDSPHIIQVVLNYVCSLVKHHMSPQHALTEMLVCALVRTQRFSDLHQLLQYGAVGDSKPLACLLLSLGNLHSAAHQLAMDMLHRLQAHEEAVEVLLGEGEVIAGVGVAKQYSAALQQNPGQMQIGNADVWNSLRARKLLSAAQNDINAFISIYHALENRNRNNRNSQSFLKGEQCDSYVQMYMNLFPDDRGQKI